MRIVRDYFGADRTTVTYENEIAGVGGNADEFFVMAEVEKNGMPAVRTTVHFTHEEMAHLLADYRQNQPIEGTAQRILLSGPGQSRLRCAWHKVAAVLQVLRSSVSALLRT
jgi:hypothetical protein